MGTLGEWGHLVTDLPDARENDGFLLAEPPKKYLIIRYRVLSGALFLR